MSSTKKQCGSGYGMDTANSSGLLKHVRGTYAAISGYKECCTPELKGANFGPLMNLSGGGKKKRKHTKKRVRGKVAKRKSHKRKTKKCKQSKHKRNQKGRGLPESKYGDPATGKFGCRQPTWDPTCF